MTEEIIRLIAYFFGFTISLYALTALDFNRFLKKNRPIPAQLLMLILAMALGTLFAEFLLALRFNVN